MQPGLQAFECATAVVPLDYDRPKGKQITLALARLPAGDPGRRIGSLFLNPGGPGGSEVDLGGETLGAMYDPFSRPDFALALQEVYELTAPEAAPTSASGHGRPSRSPSRPPPPRPCTQPARRAGPP